MDDKNPLSFLEHIRLDEVTNSVIILDQTRLPNERIYQTLKTVDEMEEAIYHLKIRGAPAIGIYASYGIYVLARSIQTTEYDSFLKQLRSYKKQLNHSRPTAVNLSWALNRMEEVVVTNSDKPVPHILTLLLKECKLIHKEDIEMCTKISEYGLSLLKDGDGILTHCNAGPLATSKYGTGLGPILLGKERGYTFKVFTDETRPLLQGARLTSFELENAGVDVTLICDNMASLVMKNGWINACLVGCDRIAANGDVANKIGTSNVAILAHYYNIPFYVLGPTSTIDLKCANGAEIPIEQRKAEEIKSMFFSEPVALPQTKSYNPAFDVTDHSLITAIITEKGVCYPPFANQLTNLLK